MKSQKPLKFRPDGKFAKGTRGGPGNPRLREIHRWRRVLEESLTEDDLRLALRKLMEAVHDGQDWAIKELLDRTVGKAKQPISLSGDSERPMEVTLKLDVDQRPAELPPTPQLSLEASSNGKSQSV